MSPLNWFKKESPLQGLGGMWGGVGSNLVGGKSPGLLGDALFYTSDATDNGTGGEVFTYTIPTKYTRWTALCVGAGGGGGGLGGGEGGGLAYLKTPVLRSQCHQVQITAGNGGWGIQGSHNNDGNNGYASQVLFWAGDAGYGSQGNYIIMARGGRGGVGNANTTPGQIRSAPFGHVYSDIYTVNSTNFGGSRGGGAGATSGGGYMSGGGGGAGGYSLNGSSTSEDKWGMGAGNNGSRIEPWAGRGGGGGGGAGNNSGNTAAGGGGGGVLLYPGTTIYGGEHGNPSDSGTSGNGSEGGWPGAHDTANGQPTEGDGSNNNQYAMYPNQYGGLSAPSLLTYPDGTQVGQGKAGKDGTNSYPGDGGFPGGAGAAGAERYYGEHGGGTGNTYKSKGAPGAVRIMMWDEDYHNNTGAPEWYNSTSSGGVRTAWDDINDEVWLNGTSKGNV